MDDDVDCDSCWSIPTSKGGWVALILGSLVTFFLHQTFYLPGPRFYLQQLYVPALDLSAAPPPGNISNPFLFFDLGLKNILDIRSISYSNVTLSFFYGHNLKPVADYVVPGFFQGRKKTAQRRDVVETVGVPWEDAVRVVSGGSKVDFRVELAAQPRFKFLFWFSKEKKVRIAADVAVDRSGLKVVEDDIMLNSSASERGIRVFVVFLCVLVTSYLLY